MHPRKVGAMAALLLALLLVGASACIGRTTQRWPRPPESSVEVLSPGDRDRYEPGPEEVTVIRHADPVRLRPAGSVSGFPLAFYNKSMRVTAGSSVIVSAGGRAEVLWSRGTSIVMFDQGIGWIGSPSRGHPTFDFQEVERARLDLLAGDVVRLMGGALLRGESGPYLLERVRRTTLRVVNQSKGMLEIDYRDANFLLGPGQAVLLPLLSAGGEPIQRGEQVQRYTGSGFPVELHGAGQPQVGEGSFRVRPQSPVEADGLGVRVALDPGDELIFSSLDAIGSEGAADGAPAAPTEEPGPAAEQPPESEPPGNDSGGVPPPTEEPTSP